MAIDGSIIQFRDELNGNATVYPLTCQSAVLGEDSQPLQTYITEYNVSHHHTNTDGTRVFTLNEAISTVPDDYKRGGLKLSFNSNNGSVETYVLDSSVWKIDAKYWKQFDVNKLTELEQRIGDIKIDKVNEFLDIKADCGDIKIKYVDIKENSKIENNMGDIKINSTNDIRIDAKVSLGEEKVNNSNYKSGIVLNLENSCGNIEVN